MTICLLLILLLILGILLTPITVKANDNLNKNELPTAGFSQFISDIDMVIKPIQREEYEIIGHNGFMSYMSYKAITDKSSNQYQLQQIAYTDEYGFRKVDNRYCVAIGNRFNAVIGQHLEVELENGEIIKCVIADIKANIDTDTTNTFTSQGCCLEFLVDTKVLKPNVKQMGDCSYLQETWQSSCTKFTVYNVIINYKRGE